MLLRKSRGRVHKDSKAANVLKDIFLFSVQLHKQIMTQCPEDHTVVYEEDT